MRSSENIIAEIDSLNKKFPAVDEYFLEVETIGADLVWLEDFCKKLQIFNSTKTKKLKFSTNLRIFPNMNFEAVFQNFKIANFDSVIIGLESGSDRLRKEILNRIYSNQHILKAVEIARKNGIKIGIFNMVGLPTETQEDYAETVKMNQLIKPDWHATSIFFPYQGTKLYDITKELNLLPQNINTKDERQKAVLDLPNFSSLQIQKSFDAFHYNVYSVNENKSKLKLFLYFIMKYTGHNSFSNLKLTVIRILYSLRLYNFAKKLFGVFQKD
jgi:radical SAM superfamily enzyme YgiQ (UPF0313 family)